MKKLGRKRSKKTPVAQTKPSSLGDVLRDRSKLGSHDLKGVWLDQKRIGKLEQKKFEAKTKKITKHVDKIKKITSIRPKIRYKKAYIGAAGVLVIAGYILVSSRNKEKSTDLLGAATSSSQSSSSNVQQPNLPKVEKTDFELILPEGKDQKSINIVRISPPNNDPTYAYVDNVSGVDIKISQQIMPKSFDTESDSKLKELADSFQATNVIQIDDNKIYHGYSEKTKVQSLIFIKNKILVFIASPQQFSDETWAAYILSLI